MFLVKNLVNIVASRLLYVYFVVDFNTNIKILRLNNMMRRKNDVHSYTVAITASLDGRVVFISTSISGQYLFSLVKLSKTRIINDYTNTMFLGLAPVVGREAPTAEAI